MAMTVSPRPASTSPTRQQLEELDELLKRMLDLPGAKEETEQAAAPSTAGVMRTMRPPQASAARPLRPKPQEEIAARPRIESVQPAAGDRATETISAMGPSLGKDNETAHTPSPDVPNPDEWIKLAATWQPSPQTWGPLAETWKQSGRALPSVAAAETVPELPATVAPPGREETPVAAQEKSPGPPHRESLEPRHTPVLVPAGETALPGREERPAAQRLETPAVYLWPLVGFNKAFDVGLLLFGPFGQWLTGRKGRNLLGSVGVVCLVLAVSCLATEQLGYLGDIRIWLWDWFGWTP